jgi:hypothetical protein
MRYIKARFERHLGCYKEIRGARRALRVWGLDADTDGWESERQETFLCFFARAYPVLKLLKTVGMVSVPWSPR